VRGWRKTLDQEILSVLSWVGSKEYHGTQAKSHLIRGKRKNRVAYFRDFLGKKYSQNDPTNSHNSVQSKPAELVTIKKDG